MKIEDTQAATPPRISPLFFALSETYQGRQTVTEQMAYTPKLRMNSPKSKRLKRDTACRFH
jgi:hypothetical protein